MSLLFTSPLEFKERTVAGTAKDFMVVRFISLAGTNEQIGEKLAQIASSRHGVKPATGDPKLIADRLRWQAEHWPENYARAQGVAKAFGNQSPEFDPTSLNYDMDVEPGCSVTYYPGSSVTNGHPMLSRNYDFPTVTLAEMTGRVAPEGARAMTADPYVVEMRPDNGFASLYIASYDLLSGCIDGINEKGLAVALLADDQAQDKRPSEGIGLSEIRLTRFLLDRCASAKEARAALATVPFNYQMVPCHYMICDASGDSFVWEITPDLKKRYVTDGKGLPQVVTNHLLAEYNAENLPEGNSFDRFRRLQSEIAQRKGKVTPAEATTINACVAVPKDTQGHATLWHSVYDLKERSMSVSFFLGRDAAGIERRSPYYAFKL
ncbi:MAG: C45 family autoproteolytic acyltransferase/hydrolase [Fimbriimonas sp.]